MARKKTTKSTANTTGTNGARLCIRMYRHGLGDCLLLRFAKQDGGSFNFLIDCGLIGVAQNPKPTMEGVVNDIVAACGNRIDVVAMTHEHWDHASGFSTQQAQHLFDEIDIGEVWYAWTEDPADKLGKKLRRERAAKVKALGSAIKGLDGVAMKGGPSADLAREREKRVTSLLDFFGLDLATAKAGAASIGKTREAYTYLQRRSDVKPRYLVPGQAPRKLPGVDNVLVYTLGPPQDEAMLKKNRPTKAGREVYELGSDVAFSDALGLAFDRMAAPCASDADCPFDASHRRDMNNPSAKFSKLLADTWLQSGQQWRQIDLEWTRIAETIALDLDSSTNNTCLVLAFEFVDTGKVFLFPADAQIGNWLSWQTLKWRVREGSNNRTVSGPDLLDRTVFYKVGHHGSHNATLRDLGLELMTSEDLVAFVPVFELQARKNRWKEMPFKPLVERLEEKTAGRVLRSDKPKPTTKQLGKLSAARQDRFNGALKVDKLYYELRYG